MYGYHWLNVRMIKPLLSSIVRHRMVSLLSLNGVVTQVLIFSKIFVQSPKNSFIYVYFEQYITVSTIWDPRRVNSFSSTPSSKLRYEWTRSMSYVLLRRQNIRNHHHWPASKNQAAYCNSHLSLGHSIHGGLQKGVCFEGKKLDFASVEKKLWWVVWGFSPRNF